MSRGLLGAARFSARICHSMARPLVERVKSSRVEMSVVDFLPNMITWNSSYCYVINIKVKGPQKLGPWRTLLGRSSVERGAVREASGAKEARPRGQSAQWEFSHWRIWGQEMWGPPFGSGEIRPLGGYGQSTYYGIPTNIYIYIYIYTYTHNSTL